MPVPLQFIVGLRRVHIPPRLIVTRIERPILAQIILSAIIITHNFQVLGRLIVLFRHNSCSFRLPVVREGSLFIAHQVEVTIAVDQRNTRCFY